MPAQKGAKREAPKTVGRPNAGLDGNVFKKHNLKEALHAINQKMPINIAADVYEIDESLLKRHHSAHRQGSLLWMCGTFILVFAFSLRTKLFAAFLGEYVFTIPTARKWIWRVCYDYIAIAFRDDQVPSFMNYGYVELDGQRPEDLFPTPEEPSMQTSANLYSALLSLADITSRENLEVLEIGSGRGGGALFVANHWNEHISKYTGLDYSLELVNLCNSQRAASNANLTFIHGDAEKLPFANNSLDLVINVESSHCYTDVPAFIAEAHRVLRHGGKFCLTDFRGLGSIDALLHQLRGLPWSSIEERDITENVLEALIRDDDRKRGLIAQRTPFFLRSLMEEFAGLRGGAVFTGLSTRTILYHLFCGKK